MDPMPFAEAVEFFQQKTLMTSAEFYALAEEVQEAIINQVFVVSGVAKADILQDIYDQAGKALEEGMTIGDFRDAFDEMCERRGWAGFGEATPFRVDNMFRTNIQTNYNVGRHKQMIAIAERRPYWEYDAVNDQFTRHSHLEMDGKVYRYDHPIWKIWYPTNGYR